MVRWNWSKCWTKADGQVIWIHHILITEFGQTTNGHNAQHCLYSFLNVLMLSSIHISMYTMHYTCTNMHTYISAYTSIYKENTELLMCTFCSAFSGHSSWFHTDSTHA